MPEMCIRDRRSVTLCPSAKLHLEVKVSRTALREKDTYDMAAVRVRILDENGTPAPYAQFPVQFAVEGSAALVGPQTAVAEGGMTGTYLPVSYTHLAAQAAVQRHLQPERGRAAAGFLLPDAAG